MAPKGHATDRTAFALPGSLGVDARGALATLDEAAAHGFAPLLVTEVAANEALALLAAVAARRADVPLGTGIVPLGSRSLAALAMGAGTVAGVSDSEFLLGVGVSTPAIVEGWHAARWEPTVDETADRLRELRRLLDGGRQGAFALAAPPGDRVQVLLGALGPRMVEVGFAAADGVIVNLTPPDALPAAQPSGRLYAYVWVAASDVAQPAARRELVGYLTTSPYARHFRRLGFGAAVDQVHRLRDERRLRDAPDVLPAEMVEVMLLPPERLPERLAEFRAAGAHPVLLPLGGRDEAPAATTRRFFDHVRAGS